MKPDRLGIDPNSTNAEKTYNHWLRTFYNFLSTVDDNSIKLNLLINHIEPNVYEFISECDDFEQATSILESIYLKPKNEIFARHILSTTRWRVSHLYTHRLLSNVIRQRLLENKTLDLSSAFDQARSLDVAQQNSNLYSQPTIPISASNQEIKSSLQNQSMTDNHLAAIVKSKQLCWFCGNIRHPRVALLNLDVIYEQSVIGMASASLSAKSDGYCYVSITLQNKIYNKVKLHVLDNLCIDIILGTDFHEKFFINKLSPVLQGT